MKNKIEQNIIINIEYYDDQQDEYIDEIQNDVMKKFYMIIIY